MPKAPKRLAPPAAPQWRIEVLVAGRTLAERFTEPGEANRAFWALARRAQRGHLDRVVLWHGPVCVDVASPGASPLGSRPPSTAGLELVAGSGAKVPQLHQHPPVPPGTAIADLVRVCACGRPVTEFMLDRCPGCPGHQGQGKVARPDRGPRRAIAASADELGL